MLIFNIESLFGMHYHSLLTNDFTSLGDYSLSNDSLIFPFKDQEESGNNPNKSSIYTHRPANIVTTVVYDTLNNQYIIYDKLGGLDYRPPRVMTAEEYMAWDMTRDMNNTWSEMSNSADALTSDRGLIPSIYIKGEWFERIFGSNTIDIRPNGSAEVSLGVKQNYIKNPLLSQRQQRMTNFDFQQKIQVNVVAKIGTKIEFKANYDTEASFQFDNTIQLKYEGTEDEIVQLIEAGNVSLPTTNSLIRGSQSLFGFKAKFKFGKTTVTGVFSEQKSESSNITVQGGSQKTEFTIEASNYEDNRHFFVAQQFADGYDNSLSELPLVKSNINITKIEVWVTQTGAAILENRNIVALQDLGEGEKTIYRQSLKIPGNNGFAYPDNRINKLDGLRNNDQIRNINTASGYLNSLGLVSGKDYEKIENARKLSGNEYSFNSKLGFLSVNVTLTADQTLAVAYEYTRVGDTTVYRVGELSDQGIASPKCLVVKLLKSTVTDTRIPLWNLMMKNVYYLGTSQVNSKDFILNVLYSGNDNGIPTAYLTEGVLNGIPLIQVMNLDRLDQQQNPNPDGLFDFINGASSNGGTIEAGRGRVYFPVREPFGKWLSDKINDPKLATKYAFDSLYTMTKVEAQQYPDKNKFTLDGYYTSSSSSDISLNAINIPPGSVVVRAGTVTLQENIDYTVDYSMGRVKIINPAYADSGVPINIALENNNAFGVQKKRFMGVNVEHVFNKFFKANLAIMNLRERPITDKTNLGDDPVNNTIWGFGVNYQKESQLITKIVDAIPLISTKAPSMVTFEGEFAQFIPGQAKQHSKVSTSYIDDFEGAKSKIDLKMSSTWFLSSTPQGQTDAGKFPEGELMNNLAYGYNRAKLAWFHIDPSVFYSANGNLRPSNVTKDELSKPYVRAVPENEVFPAKELALGASPLINILNLNYYPWEKGPYNFDLSPTMFSMGINQNGRLNNPKTRWGGIMRRIEPTDFESANIEFIEFWMMDPFIDGACPSGGQIYFNLGDISEDILRDGRKSFENGNVADLANMDETEWGYVPKTQAFVDNFDTNVPYEIQDVGYDGMNDDTERRKYAEYLQNLEMLFGRNSKAYQDAYNDPSNDNFHYYRGTDYDNEEQYADVLNRYKRYNNPEGNSTETNKENYLTTATMTPDVEDINKDNTLTENERYFQYRLDLHPDKMQIGENYIYDVYEANNVTLENGTRPDKPVKWYQFKIPINKPTEVVGNIKDYKSIRFMRMIFKGFEEEVFCRLATFDLVRNSWRRYQYDLLAQGEFIPDDGLSNTNFEISTVNIIENGTRQPIPYVMPPGIIRETNYTSLNNILENEQSMVLIVKDLKDGDAKGAFKNSNYDFRQYKSLKMFVHAESMYEDDQNQDGDLTLIFRMGSDITENYYEYEIPLQFTPFYSRLATEIWPEANELNIELEKLVAFKVARNDEYRETGLAMSVPFTTFDGNSKVTIVGTPNISDIRSILIGVRNPKRHGIHAADDGKAKSAQIWVDDLRLTDMKKDGGVAAVGRLNLQLADFGNIVLGAAYSTAGFGSLEQKANERQKENVLDYDVATTLQLGKFFPDKWAVRIPMHFDYSQSIKDPQYDPLDPDVLTKDQLKTYNTPEEQNEFKSKIQDVITRTNFSLLNVKKDRVTNPNKKKKYNYPWDIENFDVSYSYSEIRQRSIDVDFDNKRTHKGGIGYNYMLAINPVKPFAKNAKISKSKYLVWLRDFNIYYLPKQFIFRTDVSREYGERLLRNKANGIVPLITTYNKTFDWNRTYNFKWDFTENLKFEYNASANAFFNELPGSLDTDGKYTYEQKRDSIYSQLRHGGTMNLYRQDVSVNYRVPINKLPFLDWTSLDANYKTNYQWKGEALAYREQLGNTIDNQYTITLNGSVRLNALYNKSKYLKKLLSTTSNVQKTKKPVVEPKDNDTIKKKGNPEAGKKFGEGLLKVVLGLKTVSVQWTLTEGSYVPGVIATPQFFGNNFTSNVPGMAFCFGSQKDVRGKMAANGWLTDSDVFNAAYGNRYSDNLSWRATYEPFKDIKIDLDAKRMESHSYSEYFKVESGQIITSIQNQTQSGNFNITCITLGSAFSKLYDDNTTSTYRQMLSNRIVIAERLASQNANYSGKRDANGFPVGYGQNSQDVLMYSFMSAYTSQDPTKTTLSPFKSFPIPNWRLSFRGLSNIPAIKKVFRQVVINHSYRSTYTINSFSNNLDFFESNGSSASIDPSGNFVSQLNMGGIAISEQFAPLIGFDFVMNNSLTAKLEFKSSRNLSLSFANNQLTENSSQEFVIGLGYRIKDISFAIKSKSGKSNVFKNDLNLKADFSIKDNKNLIHKIDEMVSQISTGQTQFGISLSADYQISQSLTVRAFFTKNIVDPIVSNQYYRSDTTGGITIRYTLIQ